jgi:hypothetical protein
VSTQAKAPRRRRRPFEVVVSVHAEPVSAPERRRAFQESLKAAYRLYQRQCAPTVDAQEVTDG